MSSADTPPSLNRVTRTYVQKVRTDSKKLFSDLHMRTWHACTHMHTHTHDKINKKFEKDLRSYVHRDSPQEENRS